MEAADDDICLLLYFLLVLSFGGSYNMQNSVYPCISLTIRVYENTITYFHKLPRNVSDPHSLNQDPDTGFSVDPDPGSRYRSRVLRSKKNKILQLKRFQVFAKKWNNFLRRPLCMSQNGFQNTGEASGPQGTFRN
jgi:hypothetical protein